MSQMICGIEVETFPERFARETRERENAEMAGKLTEKEWRKEMQEKWRQQAKKRRLLERMAPELEASKKKLESSLWSKTDWFPRGGVLCVGFPKADRRYDTRRSPESFPRELGWRTVMLDDGSTGSEMRVRRMIGNRHGSEKALERRSTDKLKRLPRSTRKRIQIRESLEELAAMKELEALRLAEKRAEEEMDLADALRADSCPVRPMPAVEAQGPGYYPYYY